jgi:hypothetical protein
MFNRRVQCAIPFSDLYILSYVSSRRLFRAEQLGRRSTLLGPAFSRATGPRARKKPYAASHETSASGLVLSFERSVLLISSCQAAMEAIQALEMRVPASLHVTLFIRAMIPGKNTTKMYAHTHKAAKVLFCLETSSKLNSQLSRKRGAKHSRSRMKSGAAEKENEAMNPARLALNLDAPMSSAATSCSCWLFLLAYR